MCEKCKQIHNKVQTTTKHQIVDLKIPFQDVEQTVILDNIKCDEHQTMMTCLFCRTCDHLVCPDCISSNHNKHNFEPVDKILSEKLDELKGAEARYCKDLTLCQAKVEEFQIGETKYESLFDESITKIKEREQTMIDSVRKYSIELQKQIELDRKSEKNKFLNIKRQTDQAEKTIIHHQDEIMAALKSIQGSTIFATATKSQKMMSELNFNPIPSEIKYFIPVKETVTDIPNLFGSLQKMKIPQVQSDIDLEVVNSYTTDLSGINKIITVDDKSTWVNDLNKQVIRQINIDNDNITTTKQSSCFIYDMTLTSNNDILLSGDSSDIKLLTKSGEIKPFFSVSPLFPLGIHVTSDNTIIVGVMEGGNPYTPTDKSTRALLIFGMDGKQQHTYQYDSNKHRLFTFPRRITTNNNKDIVVVDSTSVDTGRVVVVGREVGLRWTYTGHFKINVTTQFRPNDVVTTTAGHIIVVCDISTHALHILSGQGYILTCKVMEDTEIEYPFSLDIDMRGQLWVGCVESKQSGAKIHKVNIL